MNLDLNLLGMFVVTGAIGLAVKLLLGRLNSIDRTLNRHGNKLVRIETKLNIPDWDGPDPL